MKFDDKLLVIEECFAFGSIPLIWLLPRPINLVASTLSIELSILICAYGVLEKHKTKETMKT